jgi:transcriptional regulator with XRE-family HTH domain
MENLFLKRRTELGLSRYQMAVKIGDATPSAIATWETDKVAPPLTRVPAISRGYDMAEEAVENEILEIGRRMREQQAATA